MKSSVTGMLSGWVNIANRYRASEEWNVLKDLHRWWFEARCSNKRLSVVGRSWLEVVTDPRYRQSRRRYRNKPRP